MTDQTPRAEKAGINPAPDNLIAAFEAEIENNKPCDCNRGVCGDWTCHEVQSLIDRIHQDWRERTKDRDQWVLDREEYISKRDALRIELAAEKAAREKEKPCPTNSNPRLRCAVCAEDIIIVDGVTVIFDRGYWRCAKHSKMPAPAEPPKVSVTVAASDHSDCRKIEAGLDAEVERLRDLIVAFTRAEASSEDNLITKPYRAILDEGNAILARRQKEESK